MDVSLFRHVCSQNSGHFSEFSEKNKNVNFLHGYIKIVTRVGLILTKDSLFWIINVFPVVLVHKMFIFLNFRISLVFSWNFENLFFFEILWTKTTGNTFSIQNKLFLVEIKPTRVKISMFPCKKLTFLFFSENSEKCPQFWLHI